MIRTFVRTGSWDETSRKGSEESPNERTANPIPRENAEESKEGSSSPVGISSAAVQTSGAQTTAERASADSAESPEPTEMSDSPLKSDTQSRPIDVDTGTVQESGIPTCEAPKALKPGIPEQAAPGVQQTFPTQELSQPSPVKAVSKQRKPGAAKGKPPRSSRKKKKSSPEEKKDVTPQSIPRTIAYSLRSAIGDGSARQRNSHSLMERRPLRPNGCSVDVSYWSHRGKRNYMEDRFVIEHMCTTNKGKENSEG